MKTNNAGCYQCTQLTSFFGQNFGHFPITIKEFYLSEAQSGKYLCSLKTGSCQMHVARFLNEENDNLSASYLMRALDGNNGLKGTKAYVISINNEIPNSSDNPSEHFRFDVDSVSLKGISDWLWTSYRDKKFKNQHLNVAEMNSFEVNVSLKN